MNREQRRFLEKKLRKTGNTADEAKAYARIIYNADKIRAAGSSGNSPAQSVLEGDRVKINQELVKSRNNYSLMADGYKRFVEESGDKVFTAHVEQENLISFQEEPKWLFWSGDLEKVFDPDDLETDTQV